MQKGTIGVSTENIFPIIKKFLYSDHEIFLRELISNAVDATQKLKTLSSMGEFKGELGELTIRVTLDSKKKTLTVSDRGIGMSKEEVEKFINQIAFSSAGEFLDKYKNQANAIIGHFGLGFYSSFMVSEKVEIVSKSWRDDSVGVHWSCDGSPEYQLEDAEKDSRGTEIVLHIDEESKEFLETDRIQQILTKYCKFLPVEVAFGKETEWKEGKSVDTDKDKIVNNTKPAWTKKPADLKEEDYKEFYRELYPMGEDPLFWIHLNVDYPFNLTGILYFPRIKKNLEIQKNKIQLYCNQVFVTDSVEGIVPDFLTLLHGVIDSPDIPLNVSRSYLQSDSNVKKISAHITKKVSDRLQEIFNSDREVYEKKWDDLKLFIEYGVITEEKFAEKAGKFSLLKTTDGKYFTTEEYETLTRENQTDKNKQLIYLYTTKPEDQYSFIDAAKSRGYDVLLMDGQLDVHYMNHLEQKLKDTRFVRVDSDVVDKLIQKDETRSSLLSKWQQDDLEPVFKSQLPEKNHFMVVFENLPETDQPVLITQNEFMRRMKDMAAMGGGMSFYGEMPDNYSLVVNANHPLIARLSEEKETSLGKELKEVADALQPLKTEKEELDKLNSGKKDEEIPQSDKDRLEDAEKKVQELEQKKSTLLEGFGKDNQLVKQLIDLALLANGMLKGEELSRFIKRSVDLIK
jgi:molecular chaperone HtpG